MKKDVEIWKDIVGYENLYQASNWGRVKSFKWGKERILRAVKNNKGYLVVNLWKDGKRKQFSVHLLVAQAFIPNDDPERKTQINHIREFEKTNNRVENLEWCTPKENSNWGTRNERVAEKNRGAYNILKKSKPVQGIDPKTGKGVVEFPSAREAERNGYNQGHVSACCRGEEKSHKGLIWRYK